MIHCLALPKCNSYHWSLEISREEKLLQRNFSKEKSCCSKCKAHGAYQTWELICLHSNCWTISCMLLKKYLSRMCSITVTLSFWWQGPWNSTKPLLWTEGRETQRTEQIILFGFLGVWLVWLYWNAFIGLALCMGLDQRNCTVFFINFNWLLICSLRRTRDWKVELCRQGHVLWVERWTTLISFPRKR